MCVVKIAHKDSPDAYRYPSDVKDLINYIYRDNKVNFGDGKNKYVFAKALPDFFGNDPKMLREYFPEIILRNHQVYGKTEGKLVHHIVLSFSYTEFRILCEHNAKKLEIIMRMLLNDYFNMGYMAGYAVHWDTRNPHIHLFVDNISFLNGNRFFLRDEALLIQGVFDDFFCCYAIHKEYPTAIYAIDCEHFFPPVHFAQNLL